MDDIKKKANWPRFSKILLGLALSSWIPHPAYSQVSSHNDFTREIMTLSHSSPVSYIAWSPDGTKLAVSSRKDTLITLWDLPSKRQLWTVDKRLGVTGGGKDLDFGPNGETLITSSAITFGPENDEATLSIISVATGKILKTLSGSKPDRGQNMPTHFVLSHDRSRLITALRSTSRILMYDTASWNVISEIGPVIDANGHIGAVQRIAWDENRNVLALGMMTMHDAHVQIWDLTTRKKLGDIQPLKVEVTDIGINPHNGELVIGGSGDIRGYRRFDAPPMVSTPDTMIDVRDDPRSLVQAWDIDSGKQLRIYYGPGDTVGGVTISPDGRMVAASKGRSLLEKTPAYIVIWDAVTTKILTQLDCGDGFLGDIAFSPDGQKIAYVINNMVRIIQLNTI